MQADKPLDGRHALITGGGTGIGAAAAEALHAAGAKVSLLGRRMEPLLAVAEGVGGAAIGCDVTDPKQIADAFSEARTRNGPTERCCWSISFSVRKDRKCSWICSATVVRCVRPASNAGTRKRASPLRNTTRR